jgi:hypothetical protein
MFEESIVSDFQPFPNLPEDISIMSSEASPDVVPSSDELRPKSSKELADQYRVSDRTIQGWFKAVTTAYPWIEIESLKVGRSAKTRYTPLCQVLIAEYREAATSLSEEDWIATVHAANPEKLPTDIPISPTEVMPSDREQGTKQADRPTSSSLLPTGRNFLDALKEEETELVELETQELQLLERMNEGLTRLTHASTQWDQANQLRRQRLLRQTRLEAASLAIELEGEFEDTLRETQYQIQRGNVPVPGKPATAEPQSQSA